MAREFLLRTTNAQRSSSAAEGPLVGLRQWPKDVAAHGPAAKALRVLVVDSRTLHALAESLLRSSRDVLSTTGEKATTSCAAGRTFDIVLLAVSDSTLAAMVLAAHLRAIERQKSHPRRAAIIACTVSTAQYLDCLVPGSGLSGALNVPWTPGTVHACLDRWRGARFLPGLDEAVTRIC